MKYTAKIMIDNVTSSTSPLISYVGKSKYFLNKKQIIKVFTGLKDMLFSCDVTTSALEKQLKIYKTILQKQILNTFCLTCSRKVNCDECHKKAIKITEDFFNALPLIQNTALGDIKAAYEGDPAAKDNYEILLCYPGLLAVTYQRLAHFLYKKDVHLIPRLITEYAHSLTGIDIHPGAKIGKNFFIDHGTGVVIGETAIIGNNVKIYQGVTLGAKSFPLDANGNPQKNIKRHPIVEDDVTIYAEATILGPVTIGRGAVIAANTWITTDIAPKTICKELKPNKKREK